MRKKLLKKIPKFKTEDEEREFWARADSTEYIDWSKGEKMPKGWLEKQTQKRGVK